MVDVISCARIFASPYSGDTSGIVRALAAGRLKSSRRLIASALADSHEDETAQALLAFELGDGSAWRPETGLALLALRNESNGFAALQLAAACAGAGGRGCVESLIKTPEWLYLDGWLTAVNGRCGLRSDGRSIIIESDLNGITHLVPHENRWAPAETAVGPWIAHASGGLAPRYVTVSGLRHSVEGFPWISGTPPPVAIAAIGRPSAADSRIETIHEGWRIILDHARIYGSWVASTAAGCLLLDPSGSQAAQSGSSFDHPGLIAIEPPDCPVFCGELLVHECSHQQLLICRMVAPMVTSGSDEMYYSPIKRSTRTIEQVLMGAHAVGNMIIYYAVLRGTMELNRSSRDRFDLYQTWFREDYRPALDRSESLTDAGRTLWEGLCNSLDCAVKQ
jgi:hypothetical protein